MEPLPPHPKRYACRRTPTPLTIDGRLDKPQWQIAPWTDDFNDIEGDIRPRPRHRTRAKMLWDDQYFYIGAQLDEPHVWATLVEHDSVIFQDNDFEVFIDPDGDNHDYYELEINALNTTWDLHLPKPYRDGGPARNEWEIPGMKTAVFVDGTLNDPSDVDKGWSVEIALPWKSLAQYAGMPCPPLTGDFWRVNFSRVEWDVTVEGGKTSKVPGRPEHNWVWSPQGAIDMHRPERWGYVHFVAADAPLAAAAPDPHWEARCRLMEVYHAQRRHREAHGRWADRVAELGLDLLEATMWPTEDGGWEAEWRGIRVRQDSKLRRG